MVGGFKTKNMPDKINTFISETCGFSEST